MPRSRGTEMHQRPSPRAPHPLRTSSSDSDPLHHRTIADRNSPKLGDRRSPRGAPADSLNQKKLGTRIADLESQLGQAQEELKNLKEQLTVAEAAKTEAQQELAKKKKKPVVLKSKQAVKKNPTKDTEASKSETSDTADEVSDVNLKETDVYEVPVGKKEVDLEVNSGNVIIETEKENKPTEVSAEPVISEPEKPSVEEFALKDKEISKLKTNLEEREKKLEVIGAENENLKNQLNEATLMVTSAINKEEEMSSRLSQLGVELDASKSNAAMLSEKLKAVEGANEALEEEMKKMRVQTGQWRKAADAAAAVLARGMDISGKIPERCGSMDKHFTGMFDTPVGGYAGFVGSPGLADDSDDGYGSVKRKSSGRRMFGDLWRKKSQK